MRLLFTLLLVGLFADVNSAQTAPSNNPAQPFAIEITAPSRVKAGSDVLIAVRLINTLTQTVNLGTESFVQGQLDARFEYECRDKAGKSVSRAYPNAGSMGDRPLIILKPGESHKEEVNITTACDLSKPGQYLIQVSRSLPDDQRVIKSNRVTVVVTP